MADFFSIPVLDLKPTQFVVGMEAVREREEKIQRLSSREKKDYLQARPVPVILGPDEVLYMTDKHHLVRALWHLGESKAYAEVQKDWSGFSKPKFWKKMRELSLVYLYDQFGNGPHPVEFLPNDIRSLADDPYRSLAKFVQKAGGFPKSSNPFSEFTWANVFRKHLPVAMLVNNLEMAVRCGLKLCQQLGPDPLAASAASPARSRLQR